MNLLPDGWHEDVPMPTYIADPALSSSESVKINKTPKTLDHDRKNKREVTKVMIEGTAVHLAVLEPEVFDDYYIVLGQCEAYKKGDGERCSNPGIYYRDGSSFCGTRSHDPYDKEPMAEGLSIIGEDSMEKIRHGKASVMGHASAKLYFQGKGRSEVVGIWTDPGTGVRCKIRIDRDLSRVSHHMDLKWTARIDDEGFQRQAGIMGWVQRSAFYRRGMAHLGRPAKASVIVAVENVAPHDCRLFVLDEKNIAEFDSGLDAIFARYDECVKTNTWPGYDQAPTPMKLKPWHLPQQRTTEAFGDDT